MKCNYTLKEALISTDPEIIYQKAREVQEENNIIKLEKRIISLKNPKYIYLFALNITRSDKTLLTKGIIRTKDLFYIYYFARNVKKLTKEDIKLLEDKIVSSKNPEYILMFARDVNKADVTRLSNVMININNYDWLISYMWAVNCPSKDICYLTMAARAIAYGTMDPIDKEAYWKSMHEIYNTDGPKRIDVKKEIKSAWNEIYDFIIRIVTFQDVREFIDFFKI